jgi:hypothetical protein
MDFITLEMHYYKVLYKTVQLGTAYPYLANAAVVD